VKAAYPSRASPANVLYQYAAAFDVPDRALLEECFTEDAVMRIEVPPVRRAATRRGRESIVTAFSRGLHGNRPTLRHLLTNVAVELRSERSAVSMCYLTVLSVEKDAIVVAAFGTYDDVLVEAGDGWRLQRRTLVIDLPSTAEGGFFTAPGAELEELTDH
jgi:SnoaL-like domain